MVERTHRRPKYRSNTLPARLKLGRKVIDAFGRFSYESRLTPDHVGNLVDPKYKLDFPDEWQGETSRRGGS